MTKGLNIVSRLTFENIPDGTLPASIPDENQYSNYSYTKTGTVTVETIDGIKFIKLNSTTAKIYSPSIITDQSKKNFQAEFDVIFDTLKVDTHLVSIGVRDLVNSLRVVASNNPAQGLRLINGNNQVTSYYRFENNKKYTICVGFKDNVISMYVDGTIIGYSYSEEFINALNVTTPSTIILGAPLNNTNDANTPLYGKLGNINISIGTTFKHEESYTKYGTNLVSFLNFENLLTTGTYKTGLEAVYEGIDWRGVESATYSNGYGNIKNISTDLTGEFTVTFYLKKFKVANANILKYGNYSVDYVAGFIPVPDPDVIVNEYTTSALNFENGLVDQIGTTVWTKEGTANVTSVNKIFGENSFETKSLGDSLYTNSNIITGGNTPFTIEFYLLLNSKSKDILYNIPIFSSTVDNASFSALSRSLTTDRLFLSRQISGINQTSITSKTKINYNVINKITISYDSSATRIFINDKLEIIQGNDSNFFTKASTNPYYFLKEYNSYTRNSYGIIDNINIHDGIATKVRDPDPYEEYLVVDLAFDGENNSTKIVDNGNKTEDIDDNWDNVISMLDFIGEIKDAKNNVYSATSGIPIFETDSPIYGPKSLKITSINNTLNLPWKSSFNLSDSDFTIEFSVKPIGQSGSYPALMSSRTYGSNGNNWCFLWNNGKLSVQIDAASGSILGSISAKTTMTFNNTYHIALVRKSNRLMLFINGLLESEKEVNGFSVNRVAPINIGKLDEGRASDNCVYGIYDNIRITKGFGRYESNYIISDTKFWKPLVWSANGNAKLSTTQKFDGFSSLYIPDFQSDISGNINFNFSNDYTISFNYISGIEPDGGFSTPFFKNVSDNFHFGVNNNGSTHKFEFVKNNVTYQFNYSGVWFSSNSKVYKIDIIKIGNNYTLYVNNVMVETRVFNITGIFNDNIEFIIAPKTNNGRSFTGYYKNFKIYKGVAVIPEDPAGKIQLDFDNNFNDKYGNSTWTNNGVAFDQVNSVKGHAAYFNGSSNLTSITQNLNFEDKPFSIELDAKRLSTSQQYSAILSNANNYSIYHNGYIGFSYASNNISTICYNDQFYNVNLFKNGLGDVVTLKVNNVCIGSVNNLSVVDFSNSILGAGTNTNNYLNGYIDNFKSYKEDLLKDIVIYKTNNNFISSITNEVLELNYPTVINNPVPYYTVILDDTPLLSDFIFECETFLEKSGNSQLRIAFRTNDFSRNIDERFGFVAYIVDKFVRIGRGSNSNSNSWNNEQTVNIPHLFDDNYHIFKVIANNSLICIYVDDSLILEYTDSTFNTIKSKIAIHGNGSFSHRPCNIKYIRVSDLDSNEIYYKDFKSKIDNVIDRPAVHLPLETNAINTGFTPLTINSVGNPTYTTIDGKKCIKFESGKYLSINSNNIFNLGTSSDFYIEMRIYVNNYTLPNRIFASALNSENSRIGLGSNTSNYYKKLYINAKDLSDYPSINECLIDQWNDIKIYRKNQKLTILLNGVISEYNVNQKEFDFSSTFIGGTPTTYFNGYMSNFKMFVGTSEIPETYNDKKVLDLDFKPTGKSYLFKDNNNKCVIHPVNITQRDYQDSQYCCTFNGVDQYLQLGRNDLFNFGNDDFVIEIKFKLTSINKTNPLLANPLTTVAGRIFICTTSTNNFQFGYGHSNGSQNIMITGGSVNINEIYNMKISRNNNTFKLTVNDEIIGELYNIDAFNLNLNNDTWIGRIMNTDFLSGIIYSIKVLRNTTDLSLLEDENTDVIAGDTTLTLSNGTDSQEVIFDNKDQNDFRFVHSNDSTKLIVNEEILEVPNVENELNELSLFTDFNAEAKDIKTYNIAFEDEDTFSGNVPIHTQFGEIEDIDTVTDIFHVVDQGDFIVNGFFEGRPEDSRYQIRNRFDYIVMHSDSGQFNYNGINERYIDDYEIYLPDTNETMPIPTEPMIRGYITVTITPTECEGINFGVKVFRRSDNKLIGIYDFNNYICTIDNLDCNKRYDCIIFDQDVNLESQCLSNRTPIPY